MKRSVRFLPEALVDLLETRYPLYQQRSPLVSKKPLGGATIE